MADDGTGSWPPLASTEAGKRGIIVGGWAELSEESAPLGVAEDGSIQWSSHIIMSSRRMVAT